MIQRFTIFDFMPLRIIELFGGIGACTAAIKQLNIPYEIVDYVEIDKYAVASYNAINNTHFEPQDITKWDKDFKDIDLIMHGSPCQDFSLAGKGAGGDEGSGTRSSLLYESIRIISKIKPKYVVWENVKNVLSKKHKHNFENYLKKMEEIGYKNYYQVLNAKDYSIPQNRERVFTISILNNNDFQFPKKQELNLRLKDMLEDEVDEKYYLSEDGDEDGVYISNIDKKRGTVQKGIVPTLKTSPDIGVVLGNYSPSGHNASRTVNSEGLSPTVMENHGTVTAIVENPNPICLNSKGGRNGIEGLQPSRKDRIYDTNGIACTIATSEFYNPNYLLKTKNKRIKKLVESINFDNKSAMYMDIYNQKAIENECGTLKSGMDHQQGNIIYDEIRIIKLTPKECWRLMGFKDEDFEKAAKVCSNTQLYKQAGNSIVVNVLVEIFKELLKEKIIGIDLYEIDVKRSLFSSWETLYNGNLPLRVTKKELSKIKIF